MGSLLPSGTVSSSIFRFITDHFRYIVDQDEFYGGLDSLDTDTFNELKSTHQDLLGDFNRTWNIVKNILSADAPEGHVPEDMEEEMSLDTKEILSYSWRGLKEARCVANLQIAVLF